MIVQVFIEDKANEAMVEVFQPGCFGSLLCLVGTLALQVVEDDFADAHGLGRDFHVFVGLDVFQGFFQGKQNGWNDVSLLVGS